MSDYASEEQTHEQQENVNYEEKHSQEDYHLNHEEQHSQQEHEVKYEQSTEKKRMKKEKEHEHEPKEGILYVLLVGCFVITVVILGLMASSILFNVLWISINFFLKKSLVFY